MRTGVLAIAVATSLFAAAPAGAASFGVKDNSLVFQATTGETNRPSINHFNGVISASDAGAPVLAGPGCTLDPNAAGRVNCPAAGIESVVVRLSDGDDRLRTSGNRGANLPATVKLSVEGGRGDDTVFGTQRRDKILGQAGHDLLYGAGGKDVLVGGGNRDRLQGHGWLYGNSGNDRLLLFTSADERLSSRAYGGAGNDRIFGSNKVRDIVDCGLGRADRFTTTDRPGLDRARRCELR